MILDPTKLNYLALIALVIAPVQLHHSGYKSAATANIFLYLTIWPPALSRFVHVINFAENLVLCSLFQMDMLVRFPDRYHLMSHSPEVDIMIRIIQK